MCLCHVRKVLSWPSVDYPASVMLIMIDTEINFAGYRPFPEVGSPWFQEEPDHGTALFVPACLGHGPRPERRPGSFEEVRQLLTDRQFRVIYGYPSGVICACLIGPGAGPEPIRPPDLLLDLLTGRASGCQRAVSSAEMIVPDRDCQAIDATETGRPGELHAKPQVNVVTSSPRLIAQAELRCQLSVAAIQFDARKDCSGVRCRAFRIERPHDRRG